MAARAVPWHQKLLRRKALKESTEVLSRTLTFTAITLQGIGATLGAGVYVITGVVAKDTAGPAVVLCFIIAGLASVLSGLCYAEFGARVPTGGSAYQYAFVGIGELGGWTAGWQLLLEYLVGCSSVARAWSGYVDSLAGGRVSAGIRAALGRLPGPGFGPQADFLALAVVLMLASVVALGVRESSRLNSALTTINIAVLAFIVLYGITLAKGSNLVPYFPYGGGGMLRGAGTAFYGYVGFDVIATSAEETIDAQVVLPRAIITALAFCCCAYVSVSFVVTAMVPWSSLDDAAPLAMAFVARGAGWARYVVAVGAMSALTASLQNTIHPMPRILRAMSDDGLLPPFIGAVNTLTKTPARATVICGCIAAVLACVFDVASLASMMSIGTLTSYSLVSGSVLVLRSRAAEELEDEAIAAGLTVSKADTRRAALESEALSAPLLVVRNSSAGEWRQFGRRPAAAAAVALLAYGLGCSLVAVSAVLAGSGGVHSLNLVCIIVLAVLGLPLAICAAVAVLRVPSLPPTHLSYHVARGQAVALSSIGVNVLLLASLPPLTWVRYLVWLAAGGLIYLLYGISHSVLNETGGEGRGRRGEEEETNVTSAEG